jgi:hypothetical protein
MGWSRGNEGKRPVLVVGVFGDLEFSTKPVKNLLFYPYHLSVGDYLPMKGSHPPKYH